jgi:hypothetical protein
LSLSCHYAPVRSARTFYPNARAGERFVTVILRCRQSGHCQSQARAKSQVRYPFPRRCGPGWDTRRRKKMPEQTSRANKAEAVLLFVAPAAQKKNPARLAFRSGLLLDIGKIDAIALHEKPYGYSDDQERRQIDRNRFKCPHVVLRHENEPGQYLPQMRTPRVKYGYPSRGTGQRDRQLRRP